MLLEHSICFGCVLLLYRVKLLSKIKEMEKTESLDLTEGELKGDGLVSNFSVNHGGFKQCPKKHKLHDSVRIHLDTFRFPFSDILSKNEFHPSQLNQNLCLSADGRSLFLPLEELLQAWPLLLQLVLYQHRQLLLLLGLVPLHLQQSCHPSLQFLLVWDPLSSWPSSEVWTLNPLLLRGSPPPAPGRSDPWKSCWLILEVSEKKIL